MPPAPAEAFWRQDKKNRAPGAIKTRRLAGFIGSRNRYFLGFFTAVLAAAGAAASSSTASLNSRP